MSASSKRAQSAVRLLYPLLAAIALGGPAPTLAADEPVLEEVRVTARRTEEGLQDTPIAVTALSGEALRSTGATNITAVSGLAPNVSFEQGSSFSGSGATPTLFIRGIGQTDFVITSDPAVGVYIDGFYVARTIGSVAELLDIERVEVLRGPQGTLFGRNTIGGAVNIVSAAPRRERAASLRIGTGEDGLFEARGSVNVPLGERAAFLGNALVRQQDGFVRAVNYDDFEAGGEDVSAWRGRFRLDATDRITVDLTADLTRDRSGPAPFHATAAVPDIPLTGNDPVFVNAFNGALATGDACTTPEGQRQDARCFGPASVVVGEGRTGSVWFDKQGRVIEPEQELDSYGAGLTVTWELPFATVRSLTGWRGFDASFNNDADFSPHLVFQNLNTDFHQDQLSQELQLSGVAFDGKVDWLVGGYWFREKGTEQLDVLTSVAVAANFATAPVFLEDDRRIDNDSLAFFSQSTVHLLEDRLHLTGGLRWTESDKRYAQQAVPNPAVNTDVPFLEGELSVSRVDPLLTVAYDLTDDLLVYLSRSEGFRDGGFPARVTGTPTVLPSFRPESVTSHELGAKFEFLDGRARVNLALFDTEYEDIQIPATRTDLPPSQQSLSVANLAAATIRGLELEGDLAVTQSLRLNASVGRLDAQIDEVVGGVLLSGPFPITEDSELPYTPDWTASLRASWRSLLGNGVALDGDVAWRWVDAQFFGPENRPEQFQGSYSRVDAAVRATTPSGAWTGEVGVRNLTDEQYATTAVAGVGNVSRNVVRGRQAFASVTYRLGGFR